jgi:predicted transposase YdaD
MKRNDILWKAALEDLFDDFLRFFYPDADELFDLEKGFEYLDKELEQLFPPEGDEVAPRYVDKLVKVYMRSGAEEWILIHIEVQGYSDKDFARRMFQYFYRILDRYDRPITAFAIFADSHKNFHPASYQRSFLGTSVSYRYNTYKIIDQDEAALAESNNPFALAVSAARLAIASKNMDDQQLFDLAYDLAKNLLSKQMPKEKIRKVMNFLRYYLRFDNPQLFINFGKEINILTERNTTMGIEEFLLDQAKKEGLRKGREEGRNEGREEDREEGLHEGREEEKRQTAIKMKENSLALDLIANITGLSYEEIERLK